MTNLQQLQAIEQAMLLLKSKRVDNIDCASIWRMLDHAHNYLDKQMTALLHAEY